MGYGNTSGQRSSRATSLGGITLPTAGYSYDAGSGRMTGVSASDFTASYRYTAGTGWNEGVTYSSGLSSTRTADVLGRLDAITWSSGAAMVSAHDYTVDAMSRRTAAQRQDGSAWSYGYNSRGGVTSAGKAGEPGKQFAFAYDGLGNRTASSLSSVADSSVQRTTSYSANALNQYEAITHPSPGWMVLRGSMNAGVTVKIDDHAPTQSSGTLWYHEQSVTNADGPVRRMVDIAASTATGGLHNGPVTTHQKGGLFIPPASEVLTHDQDGNLSGDARLNYAWDGENRLVAAEEKSGIPVFKMELGSLVQVPGETVTRKRLEFAYDARGRRIGKRTLVATGSGGFVLQQSLVHLYDGWNMIAEIDTTSSAQLLRSYEWGMDISGTMDGAGGVGGLLIERFHAPTFPNSHLPSLGAHAPCYDGNGNVTELVNLANGSVSTRYEYGVFGETISMDGSAVAEENPFLFSTKYLDAEIGLYNYGYRYYDAVNGRWLNRDPIGINGGVNLYGMVGNDPVNKWDYLGLLDESLKCCEMKRIIVNFTQVVPRVEYTISDDGVWNHPTGRMFLGTVTVKCASGNIWTGSVQTGGMMKKGSNIIGPGPDNPNPLGDDSAAPAGNFTISTSKGGKGYLLSTPGTGRGEISMHFADYSGSHGCPTLTVASEWDDLMELMTINRTKFKKSSVKITVQYSGVQPTGNRGYGRSDPPKVPVAIPVEP